MTPATQRGLIALFAIAIFASSSLLFGVQPLVGKMLLPILGGTPGVWNLCMVFFQAMLLAGYGYAHLVARRGHAGFRVVHVGVLASALAVLPIVVTDAGVPTDSDPSWWLIGVLVTSVGLPFFAVSTTSPLLQSWLAQTDHPQAKDPYFLYAASNAGSALSLLAYPLLFERVLTVEAQTHAWRGGYLVFVVLVAACAVVTGRGRDLQSETTDVATEISWQTRLRWLALAFVPSSLMLGVTTYVTTDIASFPLIWVIPLALYLVSFILVFGRRQWRPSHLLGRAMSLIALALTVALIIGANHPAVLLVPLHLGMFALAAIVCHGELAAMRPPPSRLTEFFFIMSLGGVLGGTFNAFVAPIVFDRIWEYPLMMMAACALRRTSPEEDSKPDRRFAQWTPFAVGILALVCIGIADVGHIALDRVSVLVIFGIPAVLAYTQVEKAKRFALAGVALIAAGVFFNGAYGEPLSGSRNFFGSVRVTQLDGQDGRKFHVLVHGNTIHGRVDLSLYERECKPLAYYHDQGPAPDIFTAYRADDRPAAVGLVGLGVGSLACYGQPGEKWTYYELDPEVVRVAAKSDYFRLVQQSRAEIDYVLGDARVQLARESGRSYGLLVVDAFSSDAIPVHLMTREAFRLYFERLAPNGLLAIHISNRYLNLEPVVASIAAAEGLRVYLGHNHTISRAERLEGREPSKWVVLARADQSAPKLPPRWKPLSGRAEDAWTDSFSDVLSVMSF